MKDDRKEFTPENGINPDMDQFITKEQAESLQDDLNFRLREAKASFTVAVVLQDFFHPLNEYVFKGDDPGELMYNLVWGGLAIENAGLFAAYATRTGIEKQIVRSLERLEKKGFRVGWWVLGHFRKGVTP